MTCRSFLVVSASDCRFQSHHGRLCLIIARCCTLAALPRSTQLCIPLGRLIGCPPRLSCRWECHLCQMTGIAATANTVWSQWHVSSHSGEAGLHYPCKPLYCIYCCTCLVLFAVFPRCDLVCSYVQEQPDRLYRSHYEGTGGVLCCVTFRCFFAG